MGLSSGGSACVRGGLRLASVELVPEGTNSLCRRHQVSPFSKAPSKTLEMNKIQCSCDVTARGEALTIKEEHDGESSKVLSLGLRRRGKL